jgi:hypothetical protein
MFVCMKYFTVTAHTVFQSSNTMEFKKDPIANRQKQIAHEHYHCISTPNYNLQSFCRKGNIC